MYRSKWACTLNLQSYLNNWIWLDSNTRESFGVVFAQVAYEYILFMCMRASLRKSSVTLQSPALIGKCTCAFVCAFESVALVYSLCGAGCCKGSGRPWFCTTNKLPYHTGFASVSGPIWVRSWLSIKRRSYRTDPRRSHFHMTVSAR